MPDAVKKVVLAYSGGLDTSVILRWLQETYRCEVVTFTADLGQGEELEPARRKAELLGAAQIFVDDLREEFVGDFVFPMFRANALYEGAYLLGTSIARPLIAKRQIEIARDGRRRRGRPRRHRQGQRPGPLRARLLRAGARHQGHRAVARMGSDLAHAPPRLCRPAPDPDRPRQARRGAVFGRCQSAARLGRGQGARRPVGRARGVRLQPHRRPRSRTRRAAICRDRLCARRSGRGRRRSAVAGGIADPAQRARRKARDRPARSGREPVCRHEVARGLRDARAARSCWRRIAASRASASTAARRT